MSQSAVRRLRPHLFSLYRRRTPCPRSFSASAPSAKKNETTHDSEKRIAALADHVGLDKCYPRLPKSFSQRESTSLLSSAIPLLEPGETLEPSPDDEETTWKEPISIAGRVTSVRNVGSKLAFIDIRFETEQKHEHDLPEDWIDCVQAVLQFRNVESTGATLESFKRTIKLARPGDSFLFTGWPHRTERGESSIMLTDLPQLLSPSLHQIPGALEDPETRATKRHVDMLVNPKTIETLKIRAEIEHILNSFFRTRGFVKATTPILSAGAGGAVARPFPTVASEFPNEVLNLRIAPELWLKRLVVGGLSKVYEIGPAFRNEGVDATHNPEFNMCEFYEAYATLDSLIETTCALLRELVTGTASDHLRLDTISSDSRIEFIPELEAVLGETLPDLADPAALDQIIRICKEKGLTIPIDRSLPDVLDFLAAVYLEPVCEAPTFIVNHPACLSPLAKHFTCPKTSQVVAARAELFIWTKECANMYEEENSPFEQRRKFEEQLKYQEVDGQGDERIDESYLEALEWGMPPTGGWGCGIDRLAMYLSGNERISDVLSFGTLRNVVGLTRGRR